VTALQNLLADKYEKYQDEMRRTGCTPVMERGSWIVLKIWRPFSESARASLILVHRQTARVYLFWLPSYAWTQARTYGPQPIPSDVSQIIVDELTLTIGHVFTVSWRDGAVQIEPKSSPTPRR
jgi:hypothetical protein